MINLERTVITVENKEGPMGEAWKVKSAGAAMESCLAGGTSTKTLL